jgi:hypothetical protein
VHPCFKTPILFLTALISLNCFYAQESAMTISIGGDVKNPRQWTVEQLNAQFSDQIQEVKFRNIPYSVEEKTGNGIPLYSVIKAAEPWKEEETKWTQRDRADSTLHSEMVFIVILKARDSFHAVFSLAELMPEFGSTQVWLILDKDGEPLSGADAPIRLEVSDHQDPDRNIFGISSITLVDGEKLADQLKVK